MGSRRPLPASPVIPLLAPFLDVESFNPDSRAGVFVGLAYLAELGSEYRTVARVVVFIVDITERRAQEWRSAGRKKLPSINGK